MTAPEPDGVPVQTDNRTRPEDGPQDVTQDPTDLSGADS